MQQIARVVAGFVLLFAVTALPATARAQAIPPGVRGPGILPGGALSLICVPPWRRGTASSSSSRRATRRRSCRMGFYYLTTPARRRARCRRWSRVSATPSPRRRYRKNGLAILDGVDDVRAAGRRVPAPRSGRRPARTSPACRRAAWSPRCSPSGRRSCSRARWRPADPSAASASRSTTWATSACCSTTTSRACCRDRRCRCRMTNGPAGPRRLARHLGLRPRARDRERARRQPSQGVRADARGPRGP